MMEVSDIFLDMLRDVILADADQMGLKGDERDEFVRTRARQIAVMLNTSMRSGRVGAVGIPLDA